MFSNILVAVDGSEYSLAAVRCALDEAKIWGAKVSAIYVINPGFSPAMYTDSPSDILDRDPELMNDLLVNDAKSAINAAEEIAKDCGLSIKSITEWGDPRDEIMNAAINMEADLIVLGSSGKGMVGRLLLGSVSTHIVEHSQVTTMVVRS